MVTSDSSFEWDKFKRDYNKHYVSAAEEAEPAFSVRKEELLGDHAEHAPGVTEVITDAGEYRDILRDGSWEQFVGRPVPATTEFIEKRDSELATRLAELGIDESLRATEGITLPMLVALGEKGVKTLGLDRDRRALCRSPERRGRHRLLPAEHRRAALRRTITPLSA